MEEYDGPHLPAFTCFICFEERLQVDLMPIDVVLELYQDSKIQKVCQIQRSSKVCKFCTDKYERKIQKDLNVTDPFFGVPITGPKSAKIRWLQTMNNHQQSNDEEPATSKQRPGPTSSKLFSSEPLEHTDSSEPLSQICNAPLRRCGDGRRGTGFSEEVGANISLDPSQNASRGGQDHKEMVDLSNQEDQGSGASRDGEWQELSYETDSSEEPGALSDME
jgi:hypothetical protein